MAEEVVETKAEEVKKEEPKKQSIDWKSKKLWINIGAIVILAAIVIFSIWIRTQNVSQLKDISTGNYTLGPDLDPYLYLRHAHEILENRLQDPDMMRAAPLGTPNYAKTVMMPWAIVYLYKFLSIFFKPPVATLEFAAIIAPVIFFSLTLIVFFFFMKKVTSLLTNKTNSTIIALIATAFYAVMPEMLHRTVAGVPEIESLGMLWFWAAFLFFVWAWQENKIKRMIPFAILSGIFTGLMILTWGGFRYIFMTFTLTAFLIFFFEKQKKKNFLIFISWLVPALIFAPIKMGSLRNILTSFSDTGFALVVFFILLVDLLIFNTSLKKLKEKIKLPESLISIIIAGIVGILLVIGIFGFNFIPQSFSNIIEHLLYPFGRGRIGLTVAENHSPSFVEIFGSFGLLFWVFFFGTLFLFYEAVSHFKMKKKILLNIFFILFITTFIFSKISPSSVLNGDNLISRVLYFGGLLIFILVLFYMYIAAYVKKDERTLNDFREIKFPLLLMIAFIFWMIVSMRGAVRLFFIISPALIIASSFLPIKIAELSFKTKDELYKILLWCAVVIVIILLIISFVNYTKSTSAQAKYTVPGPYYQQWQKAMAWVREDTPKGSIFIHWWDYGFWVQTLGERPTVTDGAHAVTFWDHTIGRYLLTAQNEKTALQLCKAYNVSYFLIDSSDIGKYPAYSSIGSDATGTDRLSWVSTFALDEKQTQEKKNETAYVYTGGTMLDEDIIWKGQLFPASRSGVAGFVLVIDKEKSIVSEVSAVFVYNGQQFRIPIKYIYADNRLQQVSNDPSALNSTLYIIPRITQQGINNMGAALYISEKAMRTEWVRLYLLNQTEGFELVHSEPALFVQQLKDVYNATGIGDFILTNELLGPIKIWKPNYQGIEFHEEYLERDLVPEVSGGWAKLDYLGT